MEQWGQYISDLVERKIAASALIDSAAESKRRCGRLEA